jgi:hypothetical protein
MNTLAPYETLLANFMKANPHLSKLDAIKAIFKQKITHV